MSKSNVPNHYLTLVYNKDSFVGPDKNAGDHKKISRSVLTVLSLLLFAVITILLVGFGSTNDDNVEPIEDISDYKRNYKIQDYRTAFESWLSQIYYSDGLETEEWTNKRFMDFLDNANTVREYLALSEETPTSKVADIEKRYEQLWIDDHHRKFDVMGPGWDERRP